MEFKGIFIENIYGFLDYFKYVYEGIDEDMRKKMNGIEWVSEWVYKVVEFKYNVVNDFGVRYGMIVFGKFKDGKFVDCMYCFYKLDFKVVFERIVIKKEYLVLWGFCKWEIVEEKI